MLKQKSVNELESVLLENIGDRKFEKRPLPNLVQHSIINKFELMHYDDDNLIDIVALSNNDTVETHNGDLDGLNCLVLRNEGKLQFSTLSSEASGLNISESAEDLVQISDKSYLVSSSKAIYRINK